MISISNKYRRIAELDIIKSIAIFLVIWGHCLQSLYPVIGSGYNKPAFLYIYSFHMPLFMLVSGYLSLSALNRGIKDIIITKTKQLLIPAFLTSGLCALAEFMFLRGGGYLHIFIYEIWFLKSLFFCFILLWIFVKVFKNCTIIGIVMIFIFTHVEPLYGIAEMFPCFLTGYIIRKYKLLKVNYMFSMLFLYLLNIIFWDYDYGEYELFKMHKYIFDPKYSNYYGLLKESYRVITGISGAYVFFYFITHIASKFSSKIQKILSNIGQETLGIYLVQSLVLERIMRFTMNFGFMDAIFFNFVFSPILSLLLVYLCYNIVKFLKSYSVSKFLFCK